jgi:fluoride exporter
MVSAETRRRLNRPNGLMTPGLHLSSPGVVWFPAPEGRIGHRNDMTYIAISIGAILGANARYLLGQWVADRLGSSFPYGTFVINVSGSFLIGIVLVVSMDRVVPDWFRPLLAIGFLGAYTTFSTFSYETLALVQNGAWTWALLNVAASVIVGFGAVYAGTVVGRVL